MVARLENFLRNTVRTYRVTLADLTTSTAGSTSGAQIYFELIGAPNKKVKLRHFQNFKPTGAHQFRLAHSRNQNIRAAAHAGQVTGARMRNGNRAVFPQQ